MHFTEPLQWVGQLFHRPETANAPTAMSSSTLSSVPTESPEYPAKKARLSLPHSSASSNHTQSAQTSTAPRRGSPPRRGFFSSTPRTRISPQQSVTPTLAIPSFSPPTNSLLTRVANTGNANSAPNTPAWQAARESVLSQMVTSEDLEIPATVPKVKAKPKPKTGGEGAEAEAFPQLHPPQQEAREQDEGEAEPESDDEDEANDTDASENYAPLTQSRSGRRITQATTFNPSAIIDLDPPTDMKPPPPPKTPASNTKKAPAKEKEKETHKPTRRKPGEAAVCKNCGRGHSPLSNMIVFCDGCNSPWHQHCHNPPISQEVIRIQEREWHCDTCSILRSSKTAWTAHISAERMTLAEKRRYLLSLPADNLVSLLLHATTLHPSLPIFSAAKPPTAEAVQLTQQTPQLQTVEQAAAEEELYDYFAERELLPYPKAGHGVAAKLPCESVDLGILLDEDVVSFSHSWGWTGEDLFGGQAGGGAVDGWEGRKGRTSNGWENGNRGGASNGWDSGKGRALNGWENGSGSGLNEWGNGGNVNGGVSVSRGVGVGA
ncbi:hypothetical protein G7Y79_00002g006900 [Physcia stellaris]|nr:hypothetical protein G7Y79_00002g006900 [Physcia stellaris]